MYPLSLQWTHYETHLTPRLKVYMISKAHVKPGHPSVICHDVVQACTRRERGKKKERKKGKEEGLFILFIANFIAVNIFSFCEVSDQSESF